MGRELSHGRRHAGRFGQAWVAAALAWAGAWADRAVEGAARGDPAAHRLYRSFAILHLIGPPCGLVVCALKFLLNEPVWIATVSTVSVCLFWAIPPLIRRSRSIDLPALLSVQLLVFVTLFGSYHYGGFHSPFAIWLLVAVLLGFLYAGRVIGWCLAATAVQAGVFTLFYVLLPPASERLSPGQWSALFIVSGLSATLYLSLIAAFYSRLKTESSALAGAARRNQRAAQRLSAEIAEIETENIERAAFLARASHQLRTPLNVVIGYSEMLIEDAEIEEQSGRRRHLSRIVEASRSLLTMVDKVVDLAEGDLTRVPPPAGGDEQDSGQRTIDAAPQASGGRAGRWNWRRALARLSRQGWAMATVLAAAGAIAFGIAAAGAAGSAALLVGSVLLALCAGFALAILSGARAAAAARGPLMRDALTGLRNRASFQSELDRIIALRGGETVALLFADLDGFKEVNDSLGHDAGDQLLRKVSQRFLSLTPHDALFARLGGDEFGAAAFGEDAALRIRQLAEAMVDAVAEPVTTEEDHLNIGVSVGIATGRAGAITSRELLRRSDVAMYRAKSDKRQPIQAFELHMDEALSFRRTMRKDLAVAIAEDQLHLLVQPVVGARNGELASAEALLRWNHPVLGAVSPAKLIPLAEESGQIIAIDDWVLEQALVYARAMGDIPIAVNISPVQFRHHGFAHKIVDRLAAHGLPPHLLKLEITEGVLVTHTRAASRAVNELREAGIRIALDDFGTGFSSLSYLKDFDFDTLKIDRSFVLDLEKGREGAELLRAIVDLGHSLNMSVVAEGVETAAQASLIQLLGCDYIQGYFTGRPMELAALLEMKAQGRAPLPRAQPAERL